MSRDFKVEYQGKIIEVYKSSRNKDLYIDSNDLNTTYPKSECKIIR